MARRSVVAAQAGTYEYRRHESFSPLFMGARLRGHDQVKIHLSDNMRRRSGR
jgi:hypothetical protein